MREPPYLGILCIGDPHLSSRVPGFRRDDYPRVALAKFRWCLDLARREQLLPVVLGDLFHWPRDNANWLAVELMRLLEGQTVLTVAGNHDCSENTLGDDDTLSVLLAAGRLQLLDRGPWVGLVNNVRVAIGGTSWGRPIPDAVDWSELTGQLHVSEPILPSPGISGGGPGRGPMARESSLEQDPLPTSPGVPGEGKEGGVVEHAIAMSEWNDPRWTFWIAHHDIAFPGYPGALIECREIPGVDAVINGHIHKSSEPVIRGATTWWNPGNITRINRGDATRAHVPAALRIDVSPTGWTTNRITLPHEPFEKVFHPEIVGDSVELGDSLFVQGLATLQKFKTSGAGLRDFLQRNIEQFETPQVRREILALAEEVLSNAR
jgi:DNA repair exonuclease SbcCD nuclease subunit